MTIVEKDGKILGSIEMEIIDNVKTWKVVRRIKAEDTSILEIIRKIKKTDKNLGL